MLSIIAFSSLFAFLLIPFSFARFLFIGIASLEPADYPRVFLYKNLPLRQKAGDLSFYFRDLIASILDCFYENIVRDLSLDKCAFFLELDARLNALDSI